jgi:hypothetical protein
MAGIEKPFLVEIERTLKTTQTDRPKDQQPDGPNLKPS